MTPAGEGRTGAGPEKPTRTAWIALAVLTSMNLLNYLDRYVVPGIMEDLKRSELHLTSAEGGWVVSAFIVVYMCAAPIFGSLGDRRSRPRLIALGVAIWSVAAFSSGFATSYETLLVSRAGVGIGEAAYATIAPALLADYFPTALRGRVLSIFYAATPVGAAAGFVLSGHISAAFGWRYAFFLTAIPGLALALMALRLPESERRAVSKDPVGVGDYLRLLQNRPYVLVVAGFAAYTFAVGGISVWMPSFIERVHGMSTEQAGYQVGLIVFLAGLPGSLLGGWLADRLLRRRREAYLWISGSSTLLAVPFAYLAFSLPAPYYLFATFAAELLIFVSTGPINSSILSVVPAAARAAAMALSILGIHLLGDVPAPPLLGWVSDHVSIMAAVAIIVVMLFLGGLIWLYAAWRGERAPAPEVS